MYAGKLWTRNYKVDITENSVTGNTSSGKNFAIPDFLRWILCLNEPSTTHIFAINVPEGS